MPLYLLLFVVKSKFVKSYTSIILLQDENALVDMPVTLSINVKVVRLLQLLKAYSEI